MSASFTFPTFSDVVVKRIVIVVGAISIITLYTGVLNSFGRNLTAAVGDPTHADSGCVGDSCMRKEDR